MPSDDSLLCRMSGARPGIAPKVIRAFPAARRQLRRRASALRGRRNIDLSNALELSTSCRINTAQAWTCVNPAAGRMAMDGA